jgi:hypothetical protein
MNVKDSLPEDYQFVLACTFLNCIVFSRFERKHYSTSAQEKADREMRIPPWRFEMWGCGEKENTLAKVTHWMPLPEPANCVNKLVE